MATPFCTQCNSICHVCASSVSQEYKERLQQTFGNRFVDKENMDVVKSPKHYQFFPDVEAIEIIASSMTEEMFRGYCMGNRLKYRLRAGNKDKLEQDIAKSDFYIELFNKHRHLCKVM